MVTKIGINGFGRIGRMCLRAALDNKAMQVVAINSTSDARASAHLLKYDSTHGKLNHTVEATDTEIIIDGRPITILSDRNPANLPWGKLDVDVVIESTGKFNSGKDCQVHLNNGAKKVIITAPAKDNIPTIVMGVNETTYNPDLHHVISNASCTTNCLAPVVKVIHDNFGIVNGFMSTIHAFTTDQRVLDNSHKDPRRARSCVQSIVPTTTGAAKAIGLVIPELKGKLNGISVRVPVPNVSLTDLVVELKRDVTVEEVNQALKRSARHSLRGIIEYCEEPLVSSDFLNNSHSAIVDALSTMVIDKRKLKLLAWYDNEWGYSCRVIDLAQYVSQMVSDKESSYQNLKAIG
ncbi:type I glyceraldehyde-3-phosphate dehydrogenase [Sporomusa acidovorans]|uniref:Glyceraldehyde-3-phosphate dehydrogenase n=1 Tax=Sporomusa acidovorans (strain ATCC 49682 / DSM 3132 / Mol) TaxID=1123286 RepID=A0ABZ3J6U9_SPOA4|nr:type I glyceraldehyde-3-phosphate dehydrogenase [Sporomusa acidovorans]OZC15378.1 glyceraldehyde-3-phosphate dehydrogenase [Sporomusa acidovorans DSM 3132]SDF13827.1 glyceraldehyde-3-phosphate dehydrogenase (NAD+) [Sporomusa acidovorans]